MIVQQVSIAQRVQVKSGNHAQLGHLVQQQDCPMLDSAYSG
jgi:hypothetical protein